MFRTAFVVEDGHSVNESRTDRKSSTSSARLNRTTLSSARGDCSRANFMQNPARGSGALGLGAPRPATLSTWLDPLDLKGSYGSGVPKAYIALAKRHRPPLPAPGTGHVLATRRLQARPRWAAATRSCSRGRGTRRQPRRGEPRLMVEAKRRLLEEVGLAPRQDGAAAPAQNLSRAHPERHGQGGRDPALRRRTTSGSWASNNSEKCGLGGAEEASRILPVTRGYEIGQTSSALLRGAGGGGSLLLNGHTDAVPVGHGTAGTTSRSPRSSGRRSTAAARRI